ncbi:MAG: 3-hydroxyacyl-CoA dehydrogenase [Hyphomicrobiales bacterium]|nr:3-hydroxyacyl-CoA dehydrogenase [Hyphomicrobiales bacterium]
MNLKGVSVLVTGGGSGLGAATARAMAERGAKVCCLDLNAENAAQVARELGGVGAGANVASEEDVTRALDIATKAHGAPRVVVNCAGVGTPGSTVGKNGPLPLDNFRKVIDVNLIGTFNVIRLAAARMQQEAPIGEERGVIINTASVAAFDGQIGQAAYAASKGGVVAMTLPIAREFARFGIRVCTIAPGIFLTPMLAGLPEEAQKSLGAQVPFPSRLGQPAEYGALAVHIAENAMLNGETIRLDGAIRMAPR